MFFLENMVPAKAAKAPIKAVLSKMAWPFISTSSILFAV